MADVYGIMEIGVKALKASQVSMHVAAHNIANVNTPGYSKQVAVVETTTPASLGSAGQRGTGVDVQSIERIYDAFSTAQINNQMQKLGSAEAKLSVLKSAELVFNEATGFGLGKAMSEFFNAWENLSTRADSNVERDSVIQKANNLVLAFTENVQHLNRVKEDAEKMINSTVTEINSITDRIVELNSEIKRVEAGGENANDLRDSRDLLIKKLAEKVEINALEIDDGTVTIFLPRGLVLVEATTKYTLSTGVANSQRIVNLNDVNGNQTDISSLISLGRLGGLITGRDTNVQSYLDDVDELAARVMVEMNKLHYAGYGLDGTTNNLFFSQLPLSTGANSNNTGGASINGGTVSGPTTLTADDYEIRFTAADAYDVVNTTTGVTIVTGVANYTSGADITDIPGITVVITDGGSAPANGDVFTVGINKTGLASSMSLDSAVTGSTDKIAAAQQDPLTVSGVGDNRVALQIANLINVNTMDNGSSTFTDFYSVLVTSVGSDLRQAEINHEFYDFSIQQLVNLREATSGVSIDEETTDLIKFQSGYNAAARLINMATELLDILVNLGK